MKALETALDELVEVLAEADAETPVYNWSGADQHARFWARRMVHESTVHRYDVQRALSVAEPVPGDLAVDGVDELVDVVAPRVLARDAVTLPEATMSLLGADAGAWHLRLGPAGVERLDVLASPDVTVAGTASALLLAAYGRVPWTSLQLTGDVGVLDAWSAAVRF